MLPSGSAVPKKLKHDAILEAVLEVRFEATTVPEILFGRLAEYEPWKGFGQRRMPVYEIPPLMREADPNLRYQAVFELGHPDKKRAVRVGQHVLSYHRLEPYVGWAQFKPELEEAVHVLFDKADGLVIRRLGLRYINALRQSPHGIRSVLDLNMTLAVADTRISSNVNLNFTVDLPDSSQCTVRVATPEFVQGLLPPSTSAVADVDVFTKEGFKTHDENQVKTWIDFAHTQEKEHFFRLLTSGTIQNLKEE
jgi:uncharacterized protein (TIGR04255 family)